VHNRAEFSLPCGGIEIGEIVIEAAESSDGCTVIKLRLQIVR
jgi:hypothetical protein